MVFSLAVLTLVFFPTPGPMAVASIFYGLGFGSIFPAVQALTLSSVPTERRTAASAVFFICFDLGIGLGTLFLGFLAGHFGTYRVVYLATPFLMAGMVVLFFALFGTRRGNPPRRGHKP